MTKILAEMNLKENHYLEWEYLKTSYITNMGIPCTVVGSDHAMKQISKGMIVMGGIMGLTQNPKAHKRFCLAITVTTILSK